MTNVIFDENSGNPFPTGITIADGMSMISPISTEGYCHNNELIKATTKKLAEIVGLREGEKTIDVGYGSNLSVAEAMYELGMDSYGLDSQDGLDRERYQNTLFVPPYFNARQNGVKKYCGTIEDILHPESELKARIFDLFTFWGSWESGGNNFAIGGEMGWFRAVKELEAKYGPTSMEGGNWSPYNNPEIDRLMAETKNKVLSDSTSLLNPNGGIMVISSRYAGHGAGFTTDQLPWEKRIMLRLAQRFSNLGAQEVYLIGISKDKIQKELGQHEMFAEVTQALTDDSALFSLEREVYEAKDPKGMVTAIKDMKVPLGRIDTVYGRF